MLYKRLYFQVLIGIIIGIGMGYFFPEVAINIKPLRDVFIRLIKMMVAPIIFCSIVVGIAKMGDMRKIGKVGLKVLIYFEIVSTIALVTGLIIVNFYQPGAGLNLDPATLDSSGLAIYTKENKYLSVTETLLNIIPYTIVGAFASGNILQVLLVSMFFGISLSQLGRTGKILVNLLEKTSHALFGIISLIMRLAPLGACGAMAFSIGKYGFSMLLPLGKLIFSVYIACFIFIFLILGLILKATGLSMWKFLRYIKEEIFIVYGTSSSETALPRMLTKLENMGCSKSIVGLVIPTGYSFNLDGAAIYLTMASIFIAQATNIDLTLYQQLLLLGILMITSKGGAAVSGVAFIILASTLATFETIPIAGLTLLIGVDIFMDQIRSITNLIGNGVATIVISKWEKALDIDKAKKTLDYQSIQKPIMGKQTINYGYS